MSEAPKEQKPPSAEKLAAQKAAEIAIQLFPTQEFVFDRPYSFLSAWPNAHSALAASTAVHAASRLLLHPFSVVKTRLQAQHVPLQGSAKPRYKTFMFSFADVKSQEGVKALFKGSGLALLRIPVNLFVQFSVFDLLRRNLDYNYHQTPVLLGVSGALAAAATHPLTVLKTYRECWTEGPSAKSYSLSHMMRGVQWSMAGGFLISYVSFYVFEKLRAMKYANRLRENNNNPEEVVFETSDYGVLGAVAASVGMLAAHPLDVIRKRAMLEGRISDVTSLRASFKAEHVTLLVRGLSSTFSRAIPACVLAWGLWEAVEATTKWVERRGQPDDEPWGKRHPHSRSHRKYYSVSYYW